MSLRGSRVKTMLTNVPMKPFNSDDEYVDFLITMRLCLAELIYVSILLLYGLCIPGYCIFSQLELELSCQIYADEKMSGR